MQKRLIFCLLTILFWAGGCATMSEKKAEVAIPINKGNPVVYISPMSPGGYNQAVVGVLPFRMPGRVGVDQGRALAALFRDIYLVKQVFPRVILLDKPYGGFEEAIRSGRQAGVDLVLAGKVNDLLTGTELGGARLDMSVRLINVATKNTVWHIGQTMTQPVDTPKSDWAALLKAAVNPPQVRALNGASPTISMAAQMASDMADVMNGALLVRR